MRPLVPLLAVFLLLPLAARAQDDEGVPPVGKAYTPGPPKLPATLPKGRITGTVFCSDTHKPARSAVLMLLARPDKEQTGRRGETMGRVAFDGSYNFEHMAPGEYAVIASLPGYLSPFADLTLSRTNEGDMEETLWKDAAAHGTAVVSENGSAKLDLVLDRGAAVSGRILYSDGSPATQISIELQDTAAKPKKKSADDMDFALGALMNTMLTHQSTSTDDQGRFRIAGIAPGTYRIAAVQPSSGTMDLRGEEGMGFMFGAGVDPLALRVYSGDTLHAAQAKKYDLRAGTEETGVDITVPAAAFHTVRGTASAKDGRLLNTGQITLTDTGDDSMKYRTAVQRDGSFLFPAVPSGTYTLAIADGSIGMVDSNLPPEAQMYTSLVPANSFADTSTTVLVGESDILNAALVTTEVPLTKPEDPSISASKRH